MLVDIGEDRLRETINLFKECFKDNGYYVDVFGSQFEEFVQNEMTDIIQYLVEHKGVLGYYMNKELVGFVMHFEYRKMWLFNFKRGNA